MKLITLIEDTCYHEELMEEHGLSLYIETKKHKLLFDTGASDLFIENAKKLSVDLTAVDTVVLSHGHYDHGGGLAAFLAINHTAKIYIRSNAFETHLHEIVENSESDGGQHEKKIRMKSIGISEELIHHPQIQLIENDFKIDDELFLFTNVTGRTLWPQTNLTLRKMTNGVVQQDDFSHEQNLVITQNEIQCLISGCSHCGVVSILERYEEIFQSIPDIYIGGFHLMKKSTYTDEEKKCIYDIAHRLSVLETMFYTCHCIDAKAYEMMQDIMLSNLGSLSTGDHLEI